MIKRLVSTTALMILIGSAATVHAADGKHQYSTGHVTNIDYVSGGFALDNGQAFVAEQPAVLREMWIGEGVLVRFVADDRENLADGVNAASRDLVDPTSVSTD
jgi:hypothetical protein